MAELVFPDFSGKIVGLELSADEEAPLTIVENTRFELQAGRVFLVGEVPQGVYDDEWCAGATCAVAWDKVTAYFLFESVEDYQSKVGEGKRGGFFG